MDLFGPIEKWITEHGSAGILKERIQLLKDQYEVIEKERDGLKSDNDKLRREVARLQKMVPSHEFELIRGLLWKLEGEGYEPAPYCPKCKGLMEEFPRQVHWWCSSCQFSTNWCKTPAKKESA